MGFRGGRRKFGPASPRFKLERTACTICNHWFMGYSFYTILLGLIGIVINVYNIIRLMHYPVKTRHSSLTRSEKTVPFAVERDVKLMTTILGIEHYSFIMLGAILDYPMLHIPWLLMQLCIAIVEVTIFFVKILLDGLYIKQNEIFRTIFAIFNWCQVFCLFIKQAQ